MADERDAKVQEALRSSIIGEDIPNSPSEFRERTAANTTGRTAPSSTQYQQETASELGASVPLSATKKAQSGRLALPAPARSSQYNQEQSCEIGASVPINAAKNTKEETAAEIAAPVPLIRPKREAQTTTGTNHRAVAGGTGLGTLALALSILSLFVMPILFGAIGIVLGFIARRRGAQSLGAWAIGIGIVSIIVGMFILPFF